MRRGRLFIQMHWRWLSRFQDKEAWVHHHEASAFKTLIAWFDGSGIKATRTMDRFQETSIGFWAR